MMLHTSFVAIALATLTAVNAQGGGLPDVSTVSRFASSRLTLTTD